jgi:hypothetical protein
MSQSPGPEREFPLGLSCMEQDRITPRLTSSPELPEIGRGAVADARVVQPPISVSLSTAGSPSGCQPNGTRVSGRMGQFATDVSLSITLPNSAGHQRSASRWYLPPKCVLQGACTRQVSHSRLCFVFLHCRYGYEEDDSPGLSSDPSRTTSGNSIDDSVQIESPLITNTTRRSDVLSPEEAESPAPALWRRPGHGCACPL